jgi:hypothetical protein
MVPNQSATGNGAMTLMSGIERFWCAVPEPGRWARDRLQGTCTQ